MLHNKCVRSPAKVKWQVHNIGIASRPDHTFFAPNLVAGGHCLAQNMTKKVKGGERGVQKVLENGAFLGISWSS